MASSFDDTRAAVPHIGWNGVHVHTAHPLLPAGTPDAPFYFVHSYRAVADRANAAWVLATTDYGDDRFISAVQQGNVVATQFHPEKSGAAGLALLDRCVHGTIIYTVTCKHA
jgi:imidazole glycerol-phosphate synthase